jgi:hypothetical protein
MGKPPLDARPAPHRCVVCGHDKPGFMAVVCPDCKEGFDLVDEQCADMPVIDMRVAIGPTDV